MPRLLLFCEGPSDPRTVVPLVDRVLGDAVPWLRDAVLPVVGWSEGTETFSLSWKALHRHWTNARRNRRRRVHGGYDGKLTDEHGQARKAILYTLDEHPEVDGVVLLRDDDREGRRPALEAARHESGGLIVVIGLPVPEREAWHIVGFEPADADDKARLAAETRRLGKDPRRVAHTLAPGCHRAGYLILRGRPS